LPALVVDPEQSVHLVVEVATDAGGAHARRFRLQIERLSEHSASPE
jgi:hypothetical protein